MAARTERGTGCAERRALTTCCSLHADPCTQYEKTPSAVRGPRCRRRLRVDAIEAQIEREREVLQREPSGASAVVDDAQMRRRFANWPGFELGRERRPADASAQIAPSLT